MTQLDSNFDFPHQRLDAYRVARELAAGCVALTKRMPRGFAELRDQARRAALSVVRHIAEGAGRSTIADKRARYVIARGEVGELDATLDMALMVEAVARTEAIRLRRLAGRVSAMLTGLIRRPGPE